MRLGRGPGDQRDLHDDPANETAPSELGWARVDVDGSRWIPLPLAFPDGWNRDSWALTAATAWAQQQGMAADNPEVDRLAAMISGIHKSANTRVRCHQIWIYLPDRFTAPLPVFIAIWRQSGQDRDRRLRLLTGADDKSAVRKPQVDVVATEQLGSGLRVLRQHVRDKGQLQAFLCYAFRVEEHETDLQVFTITTDLRALTAAGDDIERLVHGITVYRNTDERLLAEPE